MKVGSRLDLVPGPIRIVTDPKTVFTVPRTSVLGLDEQALHFIFVVSELDLMPPKRSARLFLAKRFLDTSYWVY